MRLFLGPSDLLHAAGTVRDSVSGAVDDVSDLFDLARRGADLMTRAETLLTRAEQMLDDTEVVVAEAGAATRAAAATVEAAAASVAGASDLIGQGHRMATPLRPIAERITPIAATVVDSISPAEAQAVVRAIDRLPQLVDAVERNVLPMLGQLDKVGPDVHDILEAVTDLATAMRGLPGMGLLQRRGERKEDEADD